jgi:hypothetical protein
MRRTVRSRNCAQSTSCESVLIVLPLQSLEKDAGPGPASGRPCRSPVVAACTAARVIGCAARHQDALKPGWRLARARPNGSLGSFHRSSRFAPGPGRQVYDQMSCASPLVTSRAGYKQSRVDFSNFGPLNPGRCDWCSQADRGHILFNCLNVADSTPLFDDIAEVSK